MKKLILSAVFCIALTGFTAAQNTSKSDSAKKQSTSKEIKKDKKSTKLNKAKAEIKKTTPTEEKQAEHVKISIPDASEHIKDTLKGVPKKKED